MKELLCWLVLIHGVNDERDRYKFFLFTTMSNTDVGLAVLVKDLEWEILEIGLDHCVIELASHETFHIKNTENYYYCILGKTWYETATHVL